MEENLNFTSEMKKATTYRREINLLQRKKENILAPDYCATGNIYWIAENYSPLEVNDWASGKILARNKLLPVRKI